MSDDSAETQLHRALYRDRAVRLWQMVAERDLHQGYADRDCVGDPLCIGMATRALLNTVHGGGVSEVDLAFRVALGELSRMLAERDDAVRRLEVQRDLTTDLSLENDSLRRQLAAAEDEIQQRMGEIDALTSGDDDDITP